MDEFALWDIQLSDADAARIYNNGTPTDLTQDPTEPNLRLYYAFEAGTGTALGDSSGAGNSGTIVNGTPDNWDSPGAN